MRKGCTIILKNISKFSETKPAPCTNSFMKKRLSIMASCMTNLSEFHIVFSSSVLIRLNNNAFEWHLCQTVNN